MSKKSRYARYVRNESEFTNQGKSNRSEASAWLLATGGPGSALPTAERAVDLVLSGTQGRRRVFLCAPDLLRALPHEQPKRQCIGVSRNVHAVCKRYQDVLDQRLPDAQAMHRDELRMDLLFRHRLLRWFERVVVWIEGGAESVRHFDPGDTVMGDRRAVVHRSLEKCDSFVLC